jgi:hypothetical protein
MRNRPVRRPLRRPLSIRPRSVLDFVQDNKLVFMGLKIENGISKFVAISRVLQVEIDGRACFPQCQSKRGFADLPRPEQGDRRLIFEIGAHLIFDATL